MTTPVADLSSPKKSTTVRSSRRPSLALRAARAGMGVLSRLAPEGAAALTERLFLSPRRRFRPAAEIETLARARHLLVPGDEAPIAAWVWGDSGPRVLLVHGWEGRGAQLGALVEPLVMLGFQVVTFDAPGHGDTGGERSSLFHFARAVEQVTDAFGPFHAIVTHSMGGPATLWACRHGALAQRLVMIAPPVDLRDFTRAFSRVLGIPEDVRGRVHRRLGERFGVPIEDVRAERLASSMRAPLLVVHDDEDREVPLACGEALAGAWPGAEILRTHGLGHQRILRDPAALRSVVRFVARDQRHEIAA